MRRCWGWCLRCRGEGIRLSERKSVRFLVSGNEVCGSVEKTMLAYNEHKELYNLRLKAVVDGIEYSNTKEFTEIDEAVIDLQKQMLPDIQIVCCQACKYGNFCPFGNAQNEIVCLKSYPPKNKIDLAKIFHSALILDTELPKSELLSWCESYEKIDNNYFTYNDWNRHFMNEHG